MTGVTAARTRSVPSLREAAAFAAATDLGTPLARGADPLAATAVTTTIAASER